MLKRFEELYGCSEIVKTVDKDRNLVHLTNFIVVRSNRNMILSLCFKLLLRIKSCLLTLCVPTLNEMIIILLQCDIEFAVS